MLTKVYSILLTTPEVASEFGKELPNWITVQSPQNANIQRMALANLDPGESSAIALAIELEDCLLILDDMKGRKFAESMGIAITGTLGVVIEAKKSGIIPSVKEVLDEIRQTNFRLTEQLEQMALRLAGE